MAMVARKYRQALGAEQSEWILQSGSVGTGTCRHAGHVRDSDDHTVLVLTATLMIPPASLTNLVAAAEEGALSLLSVHLDDATGYGRIVRDAAGQVRAIVEQKDASPAKLQIREVNSDSWRLPPGVYANGCWAEVEQRPERVLLDRRGGGAVQSGDR